MPISRTSRYARNQTAMVTDRNGVQQLAIVHRQPVQQNLRVLDYVWKAGDRVDLVAAHYYGSETSWWMYAEANPPVLDWTSPTAGTGVMVPNGLA